MDLGQLRLGLAGKETALSEPAAIGRRRFLGQLAAASLLAPTIRPARAEQASLAETLAVYATSLKYEDIPEDVVRITKRTILDTIGCAFGGCTAAPSRIAVKLASEATSKRAATVMISGVRTTPDLAVFANGVMIRYLDFNDAFVSLTHGAGHPSDTIAALLSPAALIASTSCSASFAELRTSRSQAISSPRLWCEDYPIVIASEAKQSVLRRADRWIVLRCSQ